ncbi:MAG: hypothetical protein AB8B72_06085 [Crocinitomicaceae bacterium]
MSTVALNIGVGEYVSSGNTITTYYKDGSKKGSSSVDCRDGMTAGFANPRNDYSYLLSYFVNTKNSVYKVVIYQADKEADLNRVTVNLKSKYSTVLGRGKYIMDLKYAVATDSSLVFVFSKYMDEVENFYLVQVENRENRISIKDLGISVSNQDLKTGKSSSLKFVFDGNRTIYAVQLSAKQSNYHLKIKSVELDSLTVSGERQVKLDFMNKELKICPSNTLENSRAYESGFGSVISTEKPQLDSYMKFDFFKGNLVATGLFYRMNASTSKNSRADGIFYVDLKNGTDKVTKVSSKLFCSYTASGDPTPDIYTGFGLSKFYWSYVKATDNTVWLSLNGVKSELVNLKKGGAKQGIIKYLDKKNEIAIKYLKTGKSALLETLNSYYCLYNTKTNSVGYYTQLSIKEFAK